MKVIFVASGNKAVGTVSAFVRSQYESLQREGVDMTLFPVCGHGWKAYAKAWVRLRRLVRAQHPDIVHAHYSVCGVLAAAATCCTRTKVMVSILGSFPRPSFKLRWVRFFIRHVWDATIVKSHDSGVVLRKGRNMLFGAPTLRVAKNVILSPKRL